MVSLALTAAGLGLVSSTAQARPSAVDTRCFPGMFCLYDHIDHNRGQEGALIKLPGDAVRWGRPLDLDEYEGGKLKDRVSSGTNNTGKAICIVDRTPDGRVTTLLKRMRPGESFSWIGHGFNDRSDLVKSC